MSSRENLNKENTMDIRKLSDMIATGDLEVRSIRNLDVTPKLDAADLQAAFDKNSENLVKAIDTGIVQPIIDDDVANKTYVNNYVDSKVIEVGAGDMTKNTYDTDEDGVVNAADNAVNATNATNDADGNPIVSTYVKVESLTSLLLNACYPVGSIKLTTTNVNPSTYLGGTWVAWGSGRVPCGVNADYEPMNTVEKTGGTTSQSIAHVHAIAARTSSSTSPGVASHSHSVSITSGSAGSHSHAAAGGHTHTINYPTIHSYKVGSGSNSTYYYWTTSSGASSPNGTTWTMNSAGSHSHASAGSHTHSVSGSTAASGSGSAHTHSVPAANTAEGGSTSLSMFQPYITCYMWKRTA